MKKYAFILWVALTMTSVFTACMDNDIPMAEQTAMKTATIRATIDGDLGGRVALTDDAANRVVKVDWAEGDAFKINVNGADYTFTYTENNKFECSEANFPATFESTGTVTATYPATTPTEYANQSGTLEGAAALLAMTATLDVEAEQSTADLVLNFTHKNSIVKMTLSNKNFKGKNVTSVALKSGSTTVATVSGDFTGDTENGSIVAYFAVAPQTMTDISILAVCEGSNYITTLNDNTLGIGKLYNVNKTLVGLKTAEQAVKGDLAMADGTFVSKDDIDYLTDALKGNVKGIVFWTEKDEGPSTLVGDNVADKIMQTVFPDCTHGLIVSLTNVATNCAWQGYESVGWQYDNESIYSNFQSTHETYKNYVAIESKSTEDSPKINYILGYNNTKVLEAYNIDCKNNGKDAYLVKPIEALVEWKTSNPNIVNTTGWFLPSGKELHMLCYKDVADVSNAVGNDNNVDTKTVVNASLAKVGGTQFGVKYSQFENEYYWSSSEVGGNAKLAFIAGFRDAYMNGRQKSFKGNMYGTVSVRAVCAY